MTLRALAVLLIAGAAWLEWGIAAPARRAVVEAAAEHRRAREALVEVRQALVAQRGHAATVRRADALLTRADGLSVDDGVGALRQRVVAFLDERSLDHVRIQLRPGRAADEVQLSVSARGEHSELLQLPGEFVRAEPGVVLQRVAFRAGGSGTVSLELAAIWVVPRST